MTTPKYFLPVSILFLLWSLMGEAAFFMQLMMDLDALAKTDPYQAKTFAEMPKWLWGIYGVATGAGTVGSILLLLKRALALPLFLLSLVCVVIQFGYTFGATDLVAMKPLAETAPLPAAIIIFALLEVWFASAMKKKGVLA